MKFCLGADGACADVDIGVVREATYVTERSMRSTTATAQRACCVRADGQYPACFSRRNRGANYFGMCGLCWRRANWCDTRRTPPHTSIKKTQERVGKHVTGLGAKLLRYQREMRASSQRTFTSPKACSAVTNSRQWQEVAMANRVRGSSLGNKGAPREIHASW